jgi:hypothetical protein
VQDAVSVTAQPCESDLYKYYPSGNANAGLCESITYRRWDATADGGNGAWENVSRALFTYYVTGANESNGLTGGSAKRYHPVHKRQRLVCRRFVLLPLLHGADQ